MNHSSQALAARLVRLLLLCLAIAGYLASSVASAARNETDWDGDPVTRFRASLSQAELMWLDAHPELRVGNGPDHQPFYSWRDKRYTGPSADYLELLSRRTGLRFTFTRYDDFPSALQALEHGKVDIIPTLTPTESRRRKFLFTGGYLHSPPIIVTRSGNGAVALPGNLEGIRIAIEKGHASLDVLTRSRPKAIFVETATSADALRAVSNGDADAYVGMLAVAHFYIEQLGLANLQVRQRFDADLSALAVAVSNTQPTLMGILQKAMRFISEEEGKALVRRYLPPGDGIPGVSFQLTAAEQAWLLGHGPVRMGYDQAFYPLSYTNRHHQAEGYSIELFRLLRDKAGLTVNETAGPWSSVLKKAFGGDMDVLVAVANTPERREHLHFIGPYLSSPTAIVTRSNFQQVWDLASFTGRKLALLKDHFLINRIRSAYPSIQLIEVTTQEEALSLVAAGSADVAIGNLHAVNRLIQSRFLGTLYIAGHVPDGDSELYFGVTKDAPELAAILRRALESVTPTDIATAKNRWLDTVYNPGQPSTPITTIQPLHLWLGLALAAGCLLLGFGLTRERLARRETDARLTALTRALAPLNQNLGRDAAALQRALMDDDPALAIDLAGLIQTTQHGLEAALRDAVNGKPPADT